MECSQAHELISRRCDGRLPLAEEQALARHLAQCEPCSRLAEALVRANALLGAAPRVVTPAHLSSVVVATVRRRARRERAVRHSLIAALSALLVVVVVVLPTLRVAQATGGSSALALALSQVGVQALDLLRAIAAPLLTIVRTVLLGGGYGIAIAWLVAAALLAMAWVGVVARAMRPSQRRMELREAGSQPRQVERS